MVVISRRRMARVGLLAALTVIFATTLSAWAQIPDRGNLVVTGSASPNPAAAGGQVTYTVNVKDDSTRTALGVLVTMQIPAGLGFVKCTPSVKNQPCTLSNNALTTTFATIKAHSTVKVTVLLNVPSVITGPSYSMGVTAHADSAVGGEEPRDGSATIVANVISDSIPVVFQPSGRTGTLSCSGTVGPSFFAPGETAVEFRASLGCSNSQTAITIAASNKTIDLKKFKIVGASTNQILGSVGIRIAQGATGVTIIGGGTNGSSGLEYFDYCLQDGGGNDGLKVSSLRCFRARSAGIDVVSDNVELAGVLVDRTVGGTALTTTELPGGVGIHASGKTTITDSISRRAATVGIWADGPPDVTSHAAQIGGSSRVEETSGIGILLDGAGHEVKDAYVEGDGADGVSTTGVLVNASGVFLDGLEVVEFGGQGVRFNGINATIKRSTVEAVGSDSYVVGATGTGAILSGNTAMKGLRGFVIEGAGAKLDTNRAEATVGAAFEVSGDQAELTGNSAKKAKGDAYALGGDGGKYNTNLAESNEGNGFKIAGNDGEFKNNTAKSQKKGSGFLVTGTNNSFNTNIAERNSATEWVIGAGNIDLGSNRKNGKTFSFGAAGGSFE